MQEYAETFSTVCGDFAFYQFPSPESWAKLFASVPSTFIFGFKVPEHITVIHWPKHCAVRVPGLGKTMLVRTLAEALSLSSRASSSRPT